MQLKFRPRGYVQARLLAEHVCGWRATVTPGRRSGARGTEPALTAPRTALTLALLNVTLCATAAAQSKVVVPGVTYERSTAGGQVTHIVRIAPSPLITIRPERSGAEVARRANLTTMMARRASAGALIGINGDFFNYAGGYPSGMLVIGGELIHEPEPTRSALGILAGGRITTIRTQLMGEWTSSLQPDQTTPFGFAGINRSPERRETLIYTPRYGTRTPVGVDRTDALIRLDSSGALRANRTVTGTVVTQRKRGGLTPSGRSIVLTGAGGSLTTRVRDYLKPGARVTVRATIPNLPADLVHALGGGPLLVKDGGAVHTAGEGFTYGQVGTRSARTAIGQTSSGETILVIAEGPLEGSRGQTVNQQADQLASLGAQTAVAMDSGGSTGMAIGRRLVNTPAAGERALSNALIVRYAGVQLSDPMSVITPNGDGSRDRARTFAWAAKRGRAQITLARPDGSRVTTLYSGVVGPSPRSIAIGGRSVAVHDGSYKIVASFHPFDKTRSSTRTLALTIDRTLGHLTVAKVKSRPKFLRIGFRLARRANLTTTIRNGAGRTVMTLMRRTSVSPGAHATVWDMKVRGKRLKPGVYTVSMFSRPDHADILSARFRATR